MSPSRPHLGGRDRDSHHTARGPHSPSGGRRSYAHNAYSLPVGVPLLPLYMRGAGLQERFPNRLRVGVLIGYNYISSCTRKIGSIPTPLEASWSFARRTVLMESAGISSARPTLSGRVHFGPPRGYPGVIFPTRGDCHIQAPGDQPVPITRLL